MKLVVGLGNPGEPYIRTRHNIGYLLAEAYADRHSLKWTDKTRFKASVAENSPEDVKFLLVKPTTFMNRSGEALRLIADFYQVRADSILVIHDDADMEFGKLKVVQGGNDGGHQGIRSLHAHGFHNVWRLKVGVSNEQRLPGQAIDFVLTRFKPTEWKQLPALTDAGQLLIDKFLENTSTVESVKIN